MNDDKETERVACGRVRRNDSVTACRNIVSIVISECFWSSNSSEGVEQELDYRPKELWCLNKSFGNDSCPVFDQVFRDCLGTTNRQCVGWVVNTDVRPILHNRQQVAKTVRVSTQESFFRGNGFFEMLQLALPALQQSTLSASG
jgi:hypothetical protein